MKTDWLMKAYVQETPLDKCNDMFSEHFLNNLAMKYLLPHGLLSSQICSKSETSLASTCQGKKIDMFIAQRFLKFSHYSSHFKAILGQVLCTKNLGNI